MPTNDDPIAIEQHLRSASDAILLLVREVEQLERHKRGVRPEDERFEILAKSVRDVATALAEFTQAEEDWAREADGARERVPTIADSASPPRLAAILERWRDIERRLNEAPPGSREAADLFREFEQVRAEYLDAFQAHTSAEGTDI